MAPPAAPSSASSGATALIQLDGEPKFRLSPAALQYLMQHAIPEPEAPPDDLMSRSSRLAKLLRVGDEQLHRYLRGGLVPNQQQRFDMAYRFLQRLERGDIRCLKPSVQMADVLCNYVRQLFDNEEVKMSIDNPGFPFLLPSRLVLILNSCCSMLKVSSLRSGTAHQSSRDTVVLLAPGCLVHSG